MFLSSQRNLRISPYSGLGGRGISRSQCAVFVDMPANSPPTSASTSSGEMQSQGALDARDSDKDLAWMLQRASLRRPNIHECAMCREPRAPGADVLLAADVAFCSQTCRGRYMYEKKLVV